MVEQDLWALLTGSLPIFGSRRPPEADGRRLQSSACVCFNLSGSTSIAVLRPAARHRRDARVIGTVAPGPPPLPLGGHRGLTVRPGVPTVDHRYAEARSKLVSRGQVIDNRHGQVGRFSAGAGWVSRVERRSRCGSFVY